MLRQPLQNDDASAPRTDAATGPASRAALRSEVMHHHEPSQRRMWHARRTAMEAAGLAVSRFGIRRPLRRVLWRGCEAFAMAALYGSGLYRRGVRNALDIRLTRQTFVFRDLPVAFDGYRILQIGDPHVDFLPETVTRAEVLAAGLAVDLLLVTGDLRRRTHGPIAQVVEPVARLLRAANARDGAFGILGNHDAAAVVPPLEDIGLSMLLNEAATIRRGCATISLVGTDDPYAFYTEAAVSALRRPPEGFRLALVHTAELADVAAEAGFHLYLAGHTHGGQVCLPGRRPVVTALHPSYRHLAYGPWRHGPMYGYTTSGLGVSGIPVRFNCPGEVVLITLKRCAAD